MTDLRQAAQQALEALESLQGGCTDHDDGTVEAITVWCPEVIDALRTALEQQAEPMAHVLFRQDDDGLEPIMFYPPKTAPDPRTLKDRFVLKDVWLSPPPQRPWVGLTDEEMSDTVADMNVDFGDLLWKVVCLTKIIEAKLKEKNGY